jgi:hypothetical protein
MYKLYTDKNENFIADVSVKNASLKNSIARLVVETPQVNLVFKGTIEEQKCVIPIKKLKGLLEENANGKMYLEIIVEDVYFKPWESEFVVEEHTSMKVVVQEQKEETSKPIVEVKVTEKEPIVEAAKPAPDPAPVPVAPVVPVKKPVVEQKVAQKPAPVQPKKPVVLTPAQELATICERVNVTNGNFTKGAVVEVLREYFTVRPELADNKAQIVKEFYALMSSAKK